jgi:hypothetical protein
MEKYVIQLKTLEGEDPKNAFAAMDNKQLIEKMHQRSAFFHELLTNWIASNFPETSYILEEGGKIFCEMIMECEPEIAEGIERSQELTPYLTKIEAYKKHYGVLSVF